MIENARPIEQAIEAVIRNHPKRMKAREIQRVYHDAAVKMVRDFEDASNLSAMKEAETTYLNTIRNLLNASKYF